MYRTLDIYSTWRKWILYIERYFWVDSGDLFWGGEGHFGCTFLVATVTYTIVLLDVVSEYLTYYAACLTYEALLQCMNWL